MIPCVPTLLPTTTEHGTPENLAWLAGLFEGEGSVVVTGRAKASHRPYVNVSLGMRDEDVVRRVHEVAGRGVVRHRTYAVRGESRDFFVWQCGAREPNRELLQALYPYLGVRRRTKIDEVLDAWAADV